MALPSGARGAFPLPAEGARVVVRALAADRSRIRVGISGWRYAGWRGVFYPKGLPHRRELEWASRRFDSIELNGSFYSLQRPELYRRWHAETPDGFLFAVKGGRFITHMKKLRDVETPLANFFASGVLCLDEKLGPILWQFPEAVRFDEGRFRDFFRMLPRDPRVAGRLAEGHDHRLDGRSFTRASARTPLRHAVEVRHESFRSERFEALLAEHGIALVIADTAGRWPRFDTITADFVYLRLHGGEELYTSGYSDDALATWAERIRRWRRARPRLRDAYVYFDNDAKVHAPFDAMRLRALLDGKATPAGSRPRVAASRSLPTEERRGAHPAWRRRRSTG